MAPACVLVSFLVCLAAKSVLSDTIGESKGPLCFFCHSVENPDDCQTVVACSERESCYTERYISEENHEFFRLGCKANPVCKILHDFQAAHGTTGTNCLTCCDSKYCNQNLCRKSTLDRVQCYTCSNVLTPHECENVITCDYDEVCATEEIISDQFEIRYNVKCKQRKACALLGEPSVVKPIGKRQDELCDQCCTSSFCNRDLCGATNVTYVPPTGDTSTAAPTTSLPSTPAAVTPSTTPKAAPTEKPTTATPAPTEKPTTATPALSEKPTTVTPAATEKPTTATRAPTEKPTTATPGPTEKPSTAIPKPTRKPSTVTSVPTRKPTTETPARTEKPSTATLAPMEKPTTATPTPKKKPTTATSAPTENTTSATPALTEKPTTATPAPTEKPTTATPAPTEKPTTAAATTAPTEKPTTATPAPTERPTTATTAPKVTTDHTVQTFSIISKARVTCYTCKAFDPNKSRCTITRTCGTDEQCFVGQNSLGKTQSFCLSSKECAAMQSDVQSHRQYYHQGVRYRRARCCQQDLCNARL